jgi:hypothetical protein
MEWFRSGRSQCPLCRHAPQAYVLDSDDETATTVSSMDSDALEYNISQMTLGEVRQSAQPSIRASRRSDSSRVLRLAAKRYFKADLTMREARGLAIRYKQNSSGAFASLHTRYTLLVKSKNLKEVRFRRATLTLILSNF